jgi:hypothetical protein
VNNVDNPLWIGPAKIHGFAHESENNTAQKLLRVRSILNESKAAVPLASFGEIDIRVNLFEQVIKHQRFEPIETIVTSYLGWLNSLRSEKIIIWGPPPQRQELSAEDKHDFFSYPTVGCSRSRNSLTHIFNLLILRHLNNYPKIRFVTMFYDFVDKELRTNEGALGDNLHYSLQHYNKAITMVQSVQHSEAKAVLNVDRLQTIGEIEFRVEPFTGVTDCIEFKSGNLNGEPIEYFCWGRYDSKITDPKRVFLGPSGAKYTFTGRRIEPADFLKEYFCGYSKSDFEEIVNFANPIVFDGHDNMESHLKKYLKHQVNQEMVLKKMNEMVLKHAGTEVPADRLRKLFQDFKDVFLRVGLFSGE